MAGVLVSPLYSVYPTAGLQFVLLSYVVVVLGGLGDIVGALMGSLIVAAVEVVGSYFLGSAWKEVTYFLAETPRIRIHLSEEHSAFLWSGLGETVPAIRHENLRGIVRDAATWLKDPALRGGLSPAQAGAGHPGVTRGELPAAG